MGESPCLDRVGGQVPQEVSGVRVVHHGQHGEGVPGEPKELGQVLPTRERLAGAKRPADRVMCCRGGRPLGAAGQEGGAAGGLREGGWATKGCRQGRPLGAAGGQGAAGVGGGIQTGVGGWGSKAGLWGLLASCGGAASSPPCRNKSLICWKASRTPWAHLGLWPSKSWRKDRWLQPGCHGAPAPPPPSAPLEPQPLEPHPQPQPPSPPLTAETSRKNWWASPRPATDTTGALAASAPATRWGYLILM